MNDQLEQLDVMAVGAHPDDVEIACGVRWPSWPGRAIAWALSI